MDLTDTTKFRIRDLLLMHSSVLQELCNRKILRTTNNPTGDYAEWLVKEHLSLTLAPSSEKGYDAKDTEGKKYQIKGRHLTAANPSMQLGTLRNLEVPQFDYLIAVIFEEDWSVKYAAKIPYSSVLTIAVPKRSVNGHIIRFHTDIFKNDDVENISEKLR